MTILDLQWKRSQSFFIFQNGKYPTNTPHKGKRRHIAWLSSFLFKAQCFYRDEDDLAPDDKYYIRGKRNALWFWQHFVKTITLVVFDIPIVSIESLILYCPCVLLIKRLLRLVGMWARKPVNHTSWVAVVTPTDRPKSVRNRCVIFFVALFVLSLCPFDISVGVGAFVIGLSQISSFFSFIIKVRMDTPIFYFLIFF